MTTIGDAFMLEVKRTFAEEERRILILAVGTSYRGILRDWPAYTGYSKANNRISITGRMVRRLEPAKRPTEEGVLFGKASRVENSELAKLSRISKNFGMRNRKIIIGNSVSYASDVGFTAGQGLAIYMRAGKLGEAVARAAKK